MNQMDNHNHHILSQSQFEGTTQSLRNLAQKLSVHAILLIDGGGRIMAHTLLEELNADVHTLGALTASHFAASRELAIRIGETHPFQMVLYEGARQNVFMTGVTSNIYLVVVFPKETTIGMVRLFTRRTAGELSDILEKSVDEEISIESMIDQQFEEMLGNALNEKFREHF